MLHAVIVVEPTKGLLSSTTVTACPITVEQAMA